MARNLDEPGANFNQLLELSIKLQNARTFAGTVADASTEMEQSPDSFLRPGETLEDWDTTFRKPNAAGGRIYGEYAQQIADGGRVGYKDGRTVGNIVDVRNVPYYAGKGLQGLVNSAETLSKLPFAAGELGSKLIQQPPNKKMFMEAIENITPGSWSENVGLTSLVEDMAEKRSPEAKAVGNVLGLGTEIAVPTGGAFKAGQFLLNKASKAMGKVKDGKTLNKLVDQKLTDAGQSRRDFNVMVGTSGLMVALKSIGLGGLFKAATKVKPSDDVVIRLKTFIDDSDEMTEWGPQATGKWGGAFDIESLSKAAAKTMEKLMFPGTKGTPRDRIGWSKYRSGHNEGITYDIPLEEGSYILDTLKKAGHKVKFEHIDDAGGWSVDDILNKYKNDPLYKGTAEGAEKYKKFKEKTDKWSARKKAEYHSDITDDYGRHHNPDVEDFFDTFYGVKKAKGGRIYGKYAQQLASGGRVGYQEGKTVLPKPKPKDYAGTLKMLFSQKAWNTLGPKTWTDLTFGFAKKAREAGQISDKTYQGLMMPLFGETGEKITKAIAKHDELNEGGRVGLKKGGMTPSEKWMRNYFYSGKGGYDDRMSFPEFQIGPGIDLWHRFGKSN